MKQDYKEKITNQIVKALEQGKIPWISPFEKQLIPMNYLTKRTYNGLNLLSLWTTGMMSVFLYSRTSVHIKRYLIWQ